MAYSEKQIKKAKEAIIDGIIKLKLL